MLLIKGGSPQERANMPVAEFGEKVNFGASKFTKLKSKGDKIHFRILGAPFYDGKHFMESSESDSGWEVVPCPRINEGGECEICEMFFKAHRSAKKDGLDKKETDKLTQPFKPAISFYYPVLNRETEEFEVFQTTQGVRNQIEAKIELGIKVMDKDLIVVRTEQPGSNYYSLDVVDSADTKELTGKEMTEVEKGKKTNLEDYINGQSSEEEEAEDIEL